MWFVLIAYLFGSGVLMALSISPTVNKEKEQGRYNIIMGLFFPYRALSQQGKQKIILLNLAILQLYL